MTTDQLNKGLEITREISDLQGSRDRVKDRGCADGNGYPIPKEACEAAQIAALKVLDRMLKAKHKELAAL